MIRINGIRISLDEDESLLKTKAAKLLRINEKYIEKLTIFKKSVDARKKDDIHFSYAVDLVLSLDEAQVLAKCKSPKASAVKPYHYELPENKRVSEFRPVIVGFGPAGMLAGLILAEAGLRPIIFERGKNIDDRQKDVNDFWQNRRLNEESNVFGRQIDHRNKKPVYSQGARRIIRGGRAGGNFIFLKAAHRHGQACDSG